MRMLPMLACVLLLASCGQSEQVSGPIATKDMAGGAPVAMPQLEARADAVAEAADAPASPDITTPPPPGTPPVGTIAQIAYSYAMGLELPAAKLLAVRDAHLKACTEAGPMRCQIIGSSHQQQGDSYVSASVQLRAEPKWLEGFRARIAQSAKEVDGKVTQNSISSEDLTRQLIDTDARVKAQITLRDRLQALLANRQGKLSELLQVERELARVQGEIDSMTSQLAVMRARVAMSDLAISYQSKGVPVSDQTAGPITSAFNDFLGIVSQGIAGLIRLAAFLLPFALLLVPLVWWLRRRWRTRKARRLADSPTGA